MPDADGVFLALPHGAAAGSVPDLVAEGRTIIDLGPDFRLRDPADYPRWYHFDTRRPTSSPAAVYGLPELHRAELDGAAAADTGHRRRAGLLSHGDHPRARAPRARGAHRGPRRGRRRAASSGAGRDAKADLCSPRSTRASRRTASAATATSRRCSRSWPGWIPPGGGRSANPGAVAIDFLPHLIPMTRGILSASYVRPTRSVTQAQLDELYAATYADEPFVQVVAAPPATKHVLGSNIARVFVRFDERTGRIIAIGVIDNLVKGAAGQAVQAFNLVLGLDEVAGLEQLPLAP